jgi:hypothetical protein
MTELGRALILFGALCLVVGGLLLLAGRLPWPGRLPGDILIRRGDFTFYFPIMSCLIASAILSLALYWFRR